MDSQTRTSGSDSMETDIAYFLMKNASTLEAETMLRATKKDEKEIVAFIEKYKAIRQKIKKLIQKFKGKIELKYGHLDKPEMIAKGLKFASKHNFTEIEQRAFINYVMNGDIGKSYLPYQEMENTDMARFLGFSSAPQYLFNIKDSDKIILEEIAKLYDSTQQIYHAVKQNIAIYTDCDPAAIVGKYRPDKHNLHSFIHPIIVALFLPKINVFEKRMLISNVGRMVVQRAAPYLRRYGDTQLTPLEREADMSLTCDIARDPNSLGYFGDNDSPISNLLKRFKIQIELYRNVLSLRKGEYYSKSDSFDISDSITGFITALKSYNWSWYDSPDLVNIHDEGTVMRKLLSVFSLRPTLVQITPVVGQSSMGFTNLGVAGLAFVQTPIINVKLPASLTSAAPMAPVKLSASLTDISWFIENKMLVTKNKSVIYSNKLAIFYANRRYQAMNFANLDIGCQYAQLPIISNGITHINETQLFFNKRERIGNSPKEFMIQSVVLLNKVNGHEFAALGCSSIVVAEPNTNGRTVTTYFHYNPVLAGSRIWNPATNQYVQNDVITMIPENSVNPNIPSFFETSRKLGTLFIYTSE
jgi:hypothetical protein